MPHLPTIISVFLLSLLALPAASTTQSSSPEEISASPNPASILPDLPDLPDLINNALDQPCGPNGVDCGAGYCCATGQTCSPEIVGEGDEARTAFDCIVERTAGVRVGEMDSIIGMQMTIATGPPYGPYTVTPPVTVSAQFLAPTRVGGVGGGRRTTVVTTVGVPGVTDRITGSAGGGEGRSA